MRTLLRPSRINKAMFVGLKCISSHSTRRRSSCEEYVHTTRSPRWTPAACPATKSVNNCGPNHEREERLMHFAAPGKGVLKPWWCVQPRLSRTARTAAAPTGWATIDACRSGWQHTAAPRSLSSMSSTSCRSRHNGVCQEILTCVSLALEIG